MEVCVGDEIEAYASDSILRGHGTLFRRGSLVASRCGGVERWNKLVLVEPLTGTYSAAVGHLVVGRVVQVQAARWLVDINGPSLAILPISAAGMRRRAVEGLQGVVDIRAVLVEGDLLAAEVQAVRGDGRVQLHVRDTLASKLPPGMLIDIPARSVRVHRKNNHQWSTAGIKAILGCNGAMWVGLESDRRAAKPDQVHAASQTTEALRSLIKSGQVVSSAVIQQLFSLHAGQRSRF